MSKTKIKYIDPPPITGNSEWDLFVEKTIARNRFVFTHKLDSSEKTYLLELEAKLYIILHWVTKKKWNKKHKIPYPKTSGKDYEKEGVLWYWILELCIQCHSSQWGNRYSNAYEWCRSLILERTYPDIMLIGSSDLQKEWQEIFRCESSTDFVLNEQSISGILRKGANPWHPVICKHHHHLIQACLQEQDRSDIFREKYWKPFLNHYSQWISFIRNSPKVRWVKLNYEKETPRIITSSGRGRGKLRINAFPKEILEKEIFFYLQRKTYPAKV